MKIFLVRHGEFFEKPIKLRFFGQYPKKNDQALTDFGQKQALLTAKWLANQKIDQLYSSPILRCYQTATIISSKVHIKPRFEDNLQEIKLSSSGKEWENWQEYINKRYQDLNYKVEDGESVTMLMERANKAIKKIVAQGGENIVIVTHAEFIKSFLASIGYKQYLVKKSLIPLASITTLNFNSSEFELLTLANGHHLKPLSFEALLRRLFFRLMISKVLY